eukprot:s315_g18.t1
MRYGKLLAVTIVAVSASSEAQQPRGSPEEEHGGIDDFLAGTLAARLWLSRFELQVSLLQSSLTVARTERTQEQEQALFATPVSGIQPSWLWEVEGLSNYGRAVKATMSRPPAVVSGAFCSGAGPVAALSGPLRHLGLVLQLTLPTDRTAVSTLLTDFSARGSVSCMRFPVLHIEAGLWQQLPAKHPCRSSQFWVGTDLATAYCDVMDDPPFG